MLIVAAAADCKKGYYPLLERSLRKQGIQFVFGLIKPFSWRKMILWEKQIAEVYASDTVVFVDAWDFLFTGYAWELEEIVRAQSILFHSEARCWPEPHKADLYPPCATPFRYVNGTGPAGLGAAISDAISYGMARFPIYNDESSMFADCDQRFWTDVFLAGIGTVDTQCKLSVSLNAVGPEDFTIANRRLRLTSGVMPVFVHANGASKTRYADMLDGLIV